jgi:uncharacterized Fe-S cluster protein YjdI
MSEHRGSAIVIRYDENICTHAGECVANLPAVFDVNTDPWIKPDAASVAAIKQTIAKCPSGALTCEDLE